MVMLLLVALLPVHVFAEGETGTKVNSGDTFRLDRAGTISIESEHAKLEGVSSLQFSLEISSLEADDVRFDFAAGNKAEIKEFRYEGTELTVYLAGTEALFGGNVLNVGRVVVRDKYNQDTAAMVSVKEASLMYVYGSELKVMELVELPASVIINESEEIPDDTPVPTASPEPSASPAPTATPEPSATPIPVATPTPGFDNYMEGDLTVSNGKYYFYEDGVMAASKEAYVNGAWRWFDADGTMAVDKDVYLPSSGGKWVRYNEKGEMIKGEDYRYDGWYYFEPVTGTMMKGAVTLEDGRKVFYDAVTGQMLKGDQNIGGQNYRFDEIDGHLLSGQESLIWVNIDGREYWYENWQRQGWNPADESYRGKEIYDPASDAWYWLDNVLQGAKAVGKDVYQESESAYPDRPDGTGKWVRYDAQGRMVKGWHMTDAGSYYFEPVTGAMAKGNVPIDGKTYHFDEVTGIRDMVKARTETKKN